MLGWLKRRARGNYVNVLRSHLSHTPDMFVAEPVQSMLTPIIKVVIVNSEGRDYNLDVAPDSTVDNIKRMAIIHFSPLNATVAEGVKFPSYHLILVRESRPLEETSSIQQEELQDNDTLLLLERREARQSVESSIVPVSSSPPPHMLSQEDIQQATSDLPSRNTTQPAHHKHQLDEFQVEFRRILITVIEVSIRLICADPDSEDIFSQILEKLERRHRPQVDRNALKQLVDMGFSEAKATKALQLKRHVQEAADWLLEQNNLEDISLVRDIGGDNSTNNSTSTVVENSSSSNISQDSAQRVLNTFLQYRKKWFQPNPQSLHRLTAENSFSERDAIDALRATGNKFNAALELLKNGSTGHDTEGLGRDSPIISAILTSPVIQLALPKPKTLLALMMLYESPNNANMWLSDPDTHPMVSQVIRIYHAEKHSMGRVSATQPQQSAALASDSTASSTSDSTASSTAGSTAISSTPNNVDSAGNLTTNSTAAIFTTPSMQPAVQQTQQQQPQLQTIAQQTAAQISQFLFMRNSSLGQVENADDRTIPSMIPAFQQNSSTPFANPASTLGNNVAPVPAPISNVVPASISIIPTPIVNLTNVPTVVPASISNMIQAPISNLGTGPAPNSASLSNVSTLNPLLTPAHFIIPDTTNLPPMVVRVNPEEPMSHSGSPIRRPREATINPATATPVYAHVYSANGVTSPINLESQNASLNLHTQTTPITINAQSTAILNTQSAPIDPNSQTTSLDHNSEPIDIILDSYGRQFNPGETDTRVVNFATPVTQNADRNPSSPVTRTFPDVDMDESNSQDMDIQ